MIRKYLLPALAVAGLAVAAVVAWHDDAPGAANSEKLPVASSPFAEQVAGTGIIEANGGNVAIGTPVAGIVRRIGVQFGDHVRPGDVLLQIDDSDLQARKPVALARLREAEAKLAMSRNAFALVERLSDRRAVSAEEIDNRRLTMKIDEAAVATAHAGVEELALEGRRRIVRSPAAGQILQIRVHAGEYVDGTTPLILLGDDSRRQVRVEFDEYAVDRIRPDAAAVAYFRSDSARRVALRFERIEPLVVPKTSLTGAGTERVDTRVLQVIYTFDTKDMQVHVGQQVDVFVDASARQAHPSTKAVRDSSRSGS